MLKFHTDDASVPGSDCWLAEVNLGSFENKALENEDRSTKHPKLKNEAPKSRKRSTQNSKRKHLNLENEAPIENKALENEAPKTQNHCRLSNYNFTSSMTQSESGGGSRCIRTSKGPQNPSQGFITACQLFNWTPGTERF